MLNKNQIASLLSITIVLVVAYVYFVSYTKFGGSTKIRETKRTKTPVLVLGKELQSVIDYLADDVLISLRTTAANHGSRLSLLLLTWMQSVSSNQVPVVSVVYKIFRNFDTATYCNGWLPQRQLGADSK